MIRIVAWSGTAGAWFASLLIVLMGTPLSTFGWLWPIGWTLFAINVELRRR